MKLTLKLKAQLRHQENGPEIRESSPVSSNRLQKIYCVHFRLYIPDEWHPSRFIT